MKRIVRIVEVDKEEERLARLIFENQTLAKNNQKLKSINKELNKKVKNQKEMLDSLLKKIEAIQRNHAHEKILRDVKSVSPMMGHPQTYNAYWAEIASKAVKQSYKRIK